MINLYQGKAITTKADIWVGTEHKHACTHTHTHTCIYSPQSLSPSSPPTHSLLFLFFSLSHIIIQHIAQAGELVWSDWHSRHRCQTGFLHKWGLSGVCFTAILEILALFLNWSFRWCFASFHVKSRHVSGCSGVVISRFYFFKYCTKTCLLELRSSVMCMCAW